MEKLLIVDGGSRSLDLSLATIGHIYPPTFSSGRRYDEVHLYFDDKAKAQRLVLKVKHYSTLSGRKPKWGEDEVVLYTIDGYDPDKNQWGPSERRSELPIDWKNGARLLAEMTEHIRAHFTQYNGGIHWYNR